VKPIPLLLLNVTVVLLDLLAIFKRFNPADV